MTRTHSPGLFPGEFFFVLKDGKILVCNNKVYAGRNKIDLTKDTVYVHPNTKQCNYSVDTSSFVKTSDLSVGTLYNKSGSVTITYSNRNGTSYTGDNVVLSSAETANICNNYILASVSAVLTIASCNSGYGNSFTAKMGNLIAIGGTGNMTEPVTGSCNSNFATNSTTCPFSAGSAVLVDCGGDPRYYNGVVLNWSIVVKGFSF